MRVLPPAPVIGVLMLLTTVTVVLSLGCGGSGSPDTSASPTPTPTPTSSASPTSGQAPIPATFGRVPVSTATPTTRHITPADLPPPFDTNSVSNPSSVVSRPSGAGLSVPPGFFIYQYASGLPGVRMAAIAPNGDVFLAESGPNTIVVLRDADHDGIPETRSTYATGSPLNLPFGLAFYPPGPNPTHLYIANTNGVIRYPYTAGDLTPHGAAETIVSNLPDATDHWTRGLAFRPDGAKMYVSVGSAANVEVGEDPRRAAILEYNPDGSGFRILASGLRNPVSLAIQPVTGALWTVVNERDGLGDNLPPDYATHITEGAFYGWPYTYIGANPDPRMPPLPPGLSTVTVPDVLFQAHSAPLGLTFYTGNAFPSAYTNSALATLHGSWNRAQRTGYKVVHLLPDGSYEDLVWGWALTDGTVWGRPVGITVAKDGSVLICDDGAGAVWRLTYGLAAP